MYKYSSKYKSKIVKKLQKRKRKIVEFVRRRTFLLGVSPNPYAGQHITVEHTKILKQAGARARLSQEWVRCSSSILP